MINKSIFYGDSVWGKSSSGSISSLYKHYYVQSAMGKEGCSVYINYYYDDGASCYCNRDYQVKSYYKISTNQDMARMLSLL